MKRPEPLAYRWRYVDPSGPRPHWKVRQEPLHARSPGELWTGIEVVPLYAAAAVAAFRSEALETIALALCNEYRRFVVCAAPYSFEKWRSLEEHERRDFERQARAVLTAIERSPA